MLLVRDSAILNYHWKIWKQSNYRILMFAISTIIFNRFLCAFLLQLALTITMGAYYEDYEDIFGANQRVVCL